MQQLRQHFVEMVLLDGPIYIQLKDPAAKACYVMSALKYIQRTTEIKSVGSVTDIQLSEHNQCHSRENPALQSATACWRRNRVAVTDYPIRNE